MAREGEAQDVVGTYLPGEGELTGSVKARKDGSVTGFKKDGDACAVTVDIPETGFFDLVFTVRGLGGYKENYVWADGAQAGTLVAHSDREEQAAVRRGGVFSFCLFFPVQFSGKGAAFSSSARQKGSCLRAL